MPATPKVTEAIQAFLSAQRESHPGPDLIDLWTPFMETQVNVSPGDGEPVVGKLSTYSDGLDTWWNIRIPKKANSDPQFNDYPLNWSIEEHAEGIGCTGWNWSSRKSLWVGFDFDSITGHAAGIGISDIELEKVAKAAHDIPWVEIRRSTGGRGLHLYVYLDEIATANHTEHAGLARCVLGMMSREAGFDFAGQLDVMGGVMWVWHRKITPENQGLALIKASEHKVVEDDLPINWRAHVEVVSRKRAKIRVDGIDQSAESSFDILANSRRTVPLDEVHKAVMEELSSRGYTTIWLQDYHLLQTHTRGLQEIMDDEQCRNRFGLIGFFQTLSTGDDPGKPNCFMFPVERGGWRVYRFGTGAVEAETWDQDGSDWTGCYFNRQPDLSIASKALGGLEDPDKGDFVFDSAKQAIEVSESLGQRISLPDNLLQREARLKSHKDGRLIMYVQKRDADQGMEGWIAKRDYWTRVFGVNTKQDSEEDDERLYDRMLRVLITPNHERAGWAQLGTDGEWDSASLREFESGLIEMEVPQNKVRAKASMLSRNRWTLVNLPFQPEYPGGRQWNRDAAQFRFKPAQIEDEAPHHPHWDMVFDHLGGDLTPWLKDLEWAQRAGIRTGRDYLINWVACCLRDPFQPLPYLFFWGGENCGKSTFHEALALLLTKGVVIADRALTNRNDFNGELANAVIAVIEEKNISLFPAARNRMKEWVTGLNISIRKMRTDSYMQRNTLHWIQCANELENCPVFTGDTRITVIHVPPLNSHTAEPVHRLNRCNREGQEIPKSILLRHMEEEAPHFMRTLLDLQLPPIEGRLRLPVVTTQSKMLSQELSQNSLQRFVNEECKSADGSKIAFSDFYDRFRLWLDDDEQYSWSRRKVSRELPSDHPTGRGTGNKVFIINLAWKNEEVEEGPPYIIHKGMLKQLDESERESESESEPEGNQQQE